MGRAPMGRAPMGRVPMGRVPMGRVLAGPANMAQHGSIRPAEATSSRPLSPVTAFEQGVKMRIHALVVATASALFAAAVAAPSAAQSLPKTHVKVVGLNSPTVASMLDEKPFWADTIAKASNGAVSADYTPQDQMGIDDKTMLRLLKLGVMDFAGMDISKMAGDDPRFEGCDLAGISLDIKKARAACDAYRAVIDRQMQTNWNTKLLAFGTNPPQVFWCRSALGGLADLKGKKVRVFNNTMRDFLEGVGATAVNMAFAEVVPALNNGVVDCAVTGTLSGNTANWPEVATHLYPMYLGWSINVQAVNLTTWKRFSPELQAYFTDQFKKFEDKMWATGEAALKDAENCNFNKQPCTMGKLAKMSLVEVKPAEMDTHKKLMETAVLKNWAKRCGAACATEWNNTVGKVLGLTAPTS
ncbi:MAG: TRAP transporter substrate-binding protein [Alphaproteobacteria bacterium]|nr:TRAP transporter substrate-binding protein [Alphaproteobacteria bacterium]